MSGDAYVNVHTFDPGRFQQVGVFLANALNAEQVAVVDPL
jgi:hypothetical protein